MLSPNDIPVVRQERAIPALGMLLDRAEFLAHIRAACPGHAISSAQLRYLRYKPQTSCIASYRLNVDGEDVNMYAQAHRADSGGKVSKTATRLTHHSPLGPGIILIESLHVSIHVFPNDYEIRSMWKFLDPEKGAKRLRRVVRDHPELWEATLVPLRHKPERRFVGSLGAPEPQAVLRVYTPTTYSAAYEAAGAFHDRDSLRIAPILGTAERYQAIVLRWLDGRTLDEHLLKAPEDVDAFNRVAHALSELHGQTPDVRHSHDDLDVELAGVIDMLDAIQPGAVGAARPIVDAVCSLSADSSDARAGVHGDLGPDQIVLHEDGRIGLIDFDRAHIGRRSTDFGTLIARLLLHHEADHAVATLHEAFRRAYPQCDLRPDIAAELVRLSIEPFRLRDPEWPERCLSRLALAGEVMEHDILDAR